jgi:acylphosphatase
MTGREMTDRVSGRISSFPATSERVVREKASAKRYYVSGIVQGVGYRYFAQRAARRLEISGYTKNLHDGRVEVYAIASETSHAALRAELERGPHGASVEQVSEEEAGLESRWAEGFSVEYDS